MTQLGEPVALGEVDSDDWECPFSHDKPGKVKNDLKSGKGASTRLGSRLRRGWSTQLWINDSGTIKPKRRQTLVAPCKEDDCTPPPVRVKLDGLTSQDFQFSRSAHHLIPAEASLPKSHLLNYIKEGSFISGDIGYDVNGAENGVWLPTHQALSIPMSQGKVSLPGAGAVSYSGISGEGTDSVGGFVHRYTYAVMEHTNRQFHDAHEDYSNHVIKVLNKIMVNLVVISSHHCEKCREARAGGGKLPPPHTLVGRLNLVSQRLRNFLVGGPLQWRPPLFTSPHAKDYAINARIWADRGL